MLRPTNNVAVGRIVGTFGVRGELKCDPTRAGRTLFSAGAEMTCVRGDDAFVVRIAAVRPHKGRLLIFLDGVAGRDAAQAYVGAALQATRDRIPLDDGEYLDADLVGCTVEGKDGRRYGTVESVEHYPASDMLVLRGRMVPMVGAIVVGIELAHRRIVVDPPAGLLDD